MGGLVRVLSKGERKINLKRTIADANDHYFEVDSKGLRMIGHCPQSGARWSLVKKAPEISPHPAFKAGGNQLNKLSRVLQRVVGEWQVASGDSYFDGLKIEADGSYQCKRGAVTDG